MSFFVAVKIPVLYLGTQNKIIKRSKLSVNPEIDETQIKT